MLIRPAGLRKLEAFFGLLITVMAITFGYEVQLLQSLVGLVSYGRLSQSAVSIVQGRSSGSPGRSCD